MNYQRSGILFAIFLAVLISAGCSRDAADVSASAESGSSPSMSKDCKKDIDCFIKAVRACTPSQFTLEQSVELPVTTITKIDQYEVTGGSADACSVYFKVLKWESVKNSANDEEEKGGNFQPDPKLAAAAEERMRKFTGTEGTCTFAGQRFAETLARWKNQHFSSEDFKNANCKGSFFVPENGYAEGF